MRFYHFTNMRTPIDPIAAEMLDALGDGYRLSTPIEAEPVPDITPVPQAVMIQNGIVGVYVTVEAATTKAMAGHTPMYPTPVGYWLPQRPFIDAEEPPA